MSWLELVILSFIEGLTEFLPISSTGHLIIASAYMGIAEDPFVKNFEVIIQFGAIASVLVLYWPRFFGGLEFYKKLIVAFLPAAVIGLLIKKKIDLILGSVEIVAWALLVGGIFFIWSDKKFSAQSEGGKNIRELSIRDCLLLGVAQCLAFVPGVSRAGATILGGLFLGMNRKEATEFSFLLAVPTLAGATAVKSLGIMKTITTDQLGMLAAGTCLSFVFATAAIKFFVNLVSRSGFKVFGYYRIALAIVIFASLWTGRL